MEGATPGRFPQIGGMQFGFNPMLPPGKRVLFLNLIDDNGMVTDEIIKNGKIKGKKDRTFRIVTLGFLADGGDGYPFPSGEGVNRIDLNAVPVQTGMATFANDGTEQDALAEYLAMKFKNEPFMDEETPIEEDTRIQRVEEKPQMVARLILVNAETHQDIKEIMDGDIIDFLETGTKKLSIRAETDPEMVGSVRFFLNGQLIQTENVLPYAIHGDIVINGQYRSWTPPIGKHLLKVVPYSGRGGSGEEGLELSIEFEVIDGALACYASEVMSYNPGKRKNGSPIPGNRSNPHNALGAPQENNTFNFVSLGFGGNIVLKLGGKLMDDGTSSPDLIIVETSFGEANLKCFESESTKSGVNYPEEAKLEVSMDGENWYMVGGVFCRTTFFDLSDVLNENMPYVQYLRITDMSDPSRFEVTADGFDVDGIIACPELVAAATGRLTDARIASAVTGGYNPNFRNLAPDEEPILNLEIFPNPVSEKMEVRFMAEEDSEVQLKVVDLLGKLLSIQKIQGARGRNVVELNTSKLEKGVYLIQVERNAVVETIRFVKQ
jgi:hypothetical protein